MDVDLSERAAVGGSDTLDIVGTLQLILDRIAAQTAPNNAFGEPRQIIWLPVSSDGECESPDDTAILEVRFARFVQYIHQFVFFGVQHAEADLSFALLDCSGRVIFSYPNNGAQYGSASFSPYYLSLGGTAAAIVLASFSGAGSSASPADTSRSRVPSGNAEDCPGRSAERFVRSLSG
jgi:hypothetical protein